MSQAKKPTRADERSSVHGKAPAKATARKRAPAPPEAPGRKETPGAARKPARHPTGEPLAAPLPLRAPRSTKRSAVPDRAAAPRTPKRRAIAAHLTPERRPRLPEPAPSPLAVSLGPLGLLKASPGHGGEPRPSARINREPEGPSRVMELHWGDDAPSSRRSAGLVQRWVKRGDALLRHLAEHGAARHEYRADLKEGRFVWVDGDGRVSAEAQAQVLCSWSRSTSALAMAWADPMVRASGIGRVDGMPGERDDIDEETAWRIAMEAADRARAEYIYRVTTPHAWYFLALGNLTFHPERASFCPGTPVGLVLLRLGETRLAVESRAEPTEVVRDRLSGLGRALLLEAEYAYRGTSWVGRLERAGRCLVGLGEQLLRTSCKSLSAGQSGGEWLDRQETIDLSDALALLEDEWTLLVQPG
jgi:hypothetical protein